jgi:FMN phosphatase YigB (HAD superfamily)
LEFDVAGANSLGMTTVLIVEAPSQAEGDGDPDYVIETIPELLQIIGA